MRVRKKFLLLFLVFSVFHFGNASNLQSNGKNENSQTVVTNLGNYSGCCLKIGSPKNPVTAEKTKNLVRKTEKLPSKFYHLS